MPVAESTAEPEGSDGDHSVRRNPAGVVGSAEMGGPLSGVGGTADGAHALPHVAAEITDPRDGVSLDADEGDGATCTKLDTEEEMKSLSRVIAAYLNAAVGASLCQAAATSAGGDSLMPLFPTPPYAVFLFIRSSSPSSSLFSLTSLALPSHRS
ncbi:unnamed protein product [Closterium sp. NIES-64]|nr:unnamed protein product [Closterium sp. NIES-64]